MKKDGFLARSEKFQIEYGSTFQQWMFIQELLAAAWLMDTGVLMF